MAELVYNIRGRQNVTWNRTFTFRDDTDELINFTGYTAAMKVRRAPSTSSSSVLSLTSGAGITLGGEDGTIEINITAAQMLAIPQGHYYFDVILTSAGGLKYDFITGKFDVDFCFSQ